MADIVPLDIFIYIVFKIKYPLKNLTGGQNVTKYKTSPPSITYKFRRQLKMIEK